MIINILNNKTVWKVLALMSYSPGAGYTRGEIQKLLRINNLSLDRAVKKLEFHRILRKEKRILKLNFGSEETNLLIGIINSDKKKLNNPLFDLFVILAEFVRLAEDKRIDEAYLFGSHAKKTASSDSDIDIAIFSDEKVNLAEAKDKILSIYEKEVQLHYLKKGEKGKLADEVRKHGIRII